MSGNITALEIDGSFDDCQRMVKSTFQDEDLRKTLSLSSATSTKYLSGHNQLIGGVIITNLEDLFDQLKFVQKFLPLLIPGSHPIHPMKLLKKKCPNLVA